MVFWAKNTKTFFREKDAKMENRNMLFGLKMPRCIFREKTQMAGRENAIWFPKITSGKFGT
jgi:hypothetical protein